jgi:hypothetical protein
MPDPIAPPARHTRDAIVALGVATGAVAVAYAAALVRPAAPRWTGWVMAVAVPLALVAMMALGAARRGRVPGRLLVAFVAVGALLAVAFALALALPEGPGGGTVGEPLLLGLPRRAAVVVYGVGLLPVFVLPIVYALTFDAQTLRAEDLERVRALGRAHEARALETARAEQQAGAPGRAA